MSYKYEEIGIATATGIYKGKEAIYVAQFFGTKKPNGVDISPKKTVNNFFVENESLLEEVEFEEEIFLEVEESVLGDEIDISEPTTKEQLISTPKTLVLGGMIVLILLSLFKVAYGLHVRDKRRVILGVILIILATLFTLLDQGLFIGDIR